MTAQVVVSRAVGWSSADFVAWMRERIRAAGGDPATIADEPPRFLRMPELSERSGLSEATLYRLMARNEFPKPVALTLSPQEVA